MNPLFLFFEVLVNLILYPIYFVIGCIGYVYDYFNCKKVPIPHKILITGASSGIGEATALEYAAEGMTLLLVGRNEARLNNVAERCKQKGAAVVPFVCDIRDKEKMEKFIIGEDDKAPIDLILASAGVMIPPCGKNEDYAEVTRELFSINVDGTFNTILPLLSRMQQRRTGQIALFSSGAGLCSQPMNPIYSPTKVTLMSYGESLRFIMRDYNVFVSVVSPGAIKTPMTEVSYLSGMSGLADVEGMAKAIKYGLQRDFMHIGHTPMQYWAVASLMKDMPTTVKDYVCRALIPVLKASKQYLIEFHPDVECVVCLRKQERFPNQTVVWKEVWFGMC